MGSVSVEALCLEVFAHVRKPLSPVHSLIECTDVLGLLMFAPAGSKSRKTVFFSLGVFPVRVFWPVVSRSTCCGWSVPAGDLSRAASKSRFQLVTQSSATFNSKSF